MNSCRVLKTMFLNENIEGLREKRKHMLAQMEQKLQEMHPKEEDRMFYYHSSEINPCILLVAVLCKSGKAER